MLIYSNLKLGFFFLYSSSIFCYLNLGFFFYPVVQKLELLWFVGKWEKVWKNEGNWFFPCCLTDKFFKEYKIFSLLFSYYFFNHVLFHLFKKKTISYITIIIMMTITMMMMIINTIIIIFNTNIINFIIILFSLF